MIQQTNSIVYSYHMLSPDLLCWTTISKTLLGHVELYVNLVYQTALYRTILYCAMLKNIIPQYTVLCHDEPWSIMLYTIYIQYIVKTTYHANYMYALYTIYIYMYIFIYIILNTSCTTDYLLCTIYYYAVSCSTM